VAANFLVNGMSRESGSGLIVFFMVPARGFIAAIRGRILQSARRRRIVRPTPQEMPLALSFKAPPAPFPARVSRGVLGEIRLSPNPNP
jgi:hypothetical protein